MIGFRKYLLRRALTNDPEGDFTFDARDDRRFPDTFFHFYQLANYLRLRNACVEAFRAARSVWGEYCAIVGWDEDEDEEPVPELEEDPIEVEDVA